MSGPSTWGPGDVIGDRYRVARVLGEGGYGAVYEAQSLAGGPMVALKVMHARLLTNPTASQRFDREVALVHRLRHPGIVAVLDWGRATPGQPYIVFEMLAGHTLADELAERGRLRPEEAVEITRQLLDALEEAHQRDVAHRDLKPSNIFLCEAGEGLRVKLLDFGVARSLVPDAGAPTVTSTGQIIGSPHYMAPEQVRGEGFDHRVDIYGVGLVLAEMLSGQRIVSAATTIELLLIHAGEEELALPPALERSPLGAVVARAVSKRPSARFPSAAAMRAALLEASRAPLPNRASALQSTTPLERPQAPGPSSQAGLSRGVGPGHHPSVPPRAAGYPSHGPTPAPPVGQIAAGPAPSSPPSSPPATPSTSQPYPPAPHPAAAWPGAQPWPAAPPAVGDRGLSRGLLFAVAAVALLASGAAFGLLLGRQAPAGASPAPVPMSPSDLPVVSCPDHPILGDACGRLGKAGFDVVAFNQQTEGTYPVWTLTVRGGARFGSISVFTFDAPALARQQRDLYIGDDRLAGASGRALVLVFFDERPLGRKALKAVLR
ncbi:MAG: serine/threonine-protein kinase [Polyangiaceae bacterium]